MPWIKVQDMQQENILQRERIEQALRIISECADILFDHASVMMHSINREGELLKVNRRWLATLGYDKDEVIGQKSVDFLTDESRLYTIQDTLPLFWQAGSDRSTGLRFVRKNGRVISVLLDGEAMDDGYGGVIGLAILRAPDDRGQWQQASAILSALKKIDHLKRRLSGLLIAEETGPGSANAELLPSSSVSAGKVEAASDLENELVELARQVSENLRDMAEVQVKRLEVLLSRQSQLILLADTIETSIAELVSGESDLESPE